MKQLFTLFFVLAIGISAWGQVTDPTFSPLDNATGVSVSPTLSMTFDGYTSVSLAEGKFIYVRNITTSTIPFTLATGDIEFDVPKDPKIQISGNVLTIDLSSEELSYSNEYAIRIGDNVVDVDGVFYNDLNNYTKWSFTTEAAPVIPQWAVTYPNLQNISKAAIDVYGQVDLDGNCHLVVTNSATAPSAANIKAGLDHTGAAATIVSSNNAVTADTEFFVNLNIASLSSETQYWVYAVCDDGTDNFSTVEQLTFTTQDTQTPTYTATFPSISDTTGTGATLNVSINDNGQFYWVVLPAADTAPTAAQVKVGHDASDSLAPFSGNPALTANVTAQAAVTGLAYSTAYTAYIVSTDDNNNDIETSIPTDLDFTTLAAPPSVTSYLPTDDATDVLVSQSLQVTFNENIQIVSGSAARVYIMRSIDDSEFVSYGVSNPNKTISGSTLTLNHANFEENTEYYVTMGNGFVESVASGVDFGGISSTTQWTFTTEVLAPQWIATFPNITPPTKTDVVVNGQVDKDATFYLVITENASAPSATQIKSGDNENDEPALLAITDAATANATFSPSLNITSLSSETAYWVHLVTETTLDKFSTVQSRSFTTQDTQAPEYGESFPSVEILDGTSISLNVIINDDGHFYYVILPSGDAAPSIAQVIAATDANDLAVPFPFGFESPLSDGVVGSGLVFGLDYSTSYIAYLVSKDDNNNYIETSTATAIPFTTPGPPPTIVSFFPLQNATDVPIGQNLQITFNENIQFVAGSAAMLSIRRVSDNGLFASYDITSENVTITDDVLTVTPSSPLIENRSYYITMEDRFVESITNGEFTGFSGSTFWTFTTETLPAQWVSGYPTIGIPTKTSVVVNGRVSKSGNYYMVLTQSASAPTAAQVKLGQDETGAAALIVESDVSTAGITFSPTLDISALETQTQYYVYVVAETTLDKFSTVEQLTFTTVQTSWAATYPKVQNQSKTSLDVLGQVDAGGVYRLVVTASGTVPTEAQIIAAQNEAGAPALLATTGTATANSEFTTNLDLTSLSSLTNYWIHMLVVDEFGNYSPIATIPFTQQDTEAPIYTAPTPNVTNVSGTAATVEIKINEAGIVNYVILLSSATAPSIAQVLAGTDANDVIVTNSGNRILAANNLAQITASDYASQTSYVAYLVTRDNNENYIETGSPREVPFTTLDNTAPVATFDPENLEVDVLLDKTITITLSEEVYNAAGQLITNANVGTIVSLRENSSVSTLVPTTVTYDVVNFVITIDPTSILKELQVYNINLLALRDATGNTTTAQNSTFTTQDVTPPVTIFANPGDGATNRSIGSPIVISFDEAVQKVDGTVISDTDLLTLITFSPAVTFTASINAANTIVTVYPNPYLAPSTEYTLTVNPVEDLSGNEQAIGKSISFTTANFNTWVGTTDNSFTNPSNYTGDYSAGASVLATAGSPLMTISANATMPNLIIEPLAKVTIETGATVTIGEELTLKSDATGTGSLIINGAISMTNSKINVEQHISDANQYKFISSPVATSSPSGVGADGVIYTWDNVYGNWNSVSPGSNFTKMQGYILKSSHNLLYKGALNSGVSSIDVKGTPRNSGFTLVGNPYTASIDWDLIDIEDKVDIVNKFWIDVNGLYGSYDVASGISINLEGDVSLIPSSHAFWVRANWEAEVTETITGFLSLNESYLVHNENSYLKSSNATNNVIPHIKLVGIHNDTRCEKAIGFTPDASEFFEKYDTERFFGFTTKAIELYSPVGNKKLAINTLPELINNMHIPLGYKTQTSGNFSIKLQDIVKIQEGLQVLLTDHLEGVTVDLNNGEPYVFSSAAVNSTDRFSLELIESISTDMPKQTNSESSVNIYSKQQTVFIQVEDLKNPEYKIYNTDGKLIKAGNLDEHSLNQIQLNIGQGIVIVKVIGDDRVTSKKVIIN